MAHKPDDIWLGPNHHPYHPQSLQLPTYAPNSSPIPVILGSFGGLIAGFIGAGVGLARRYNPSLGRKSAGEQFTIVWFLLCGFLHLFFEGYFILFHSTIPSSQSLFAQLWKEYSLSDSRYVAADPFMLCIETLTVLIWGPLSLLVALLIATDTTTTTTSSSSSSSSSHSAGRRALRHVLQITVCIGHLYGVALYYGTCGFIERYAGVTYSRPEFLYFWVYYAGMNAPWALVPAWLLWRSGKEIVRAFEGSEGKKMD